MDIAYTRVKWIKVKLFERFRKEPQKGVQLQAPFDYSANYIPSDVYYEPSTTNVTKA